MRDGQRHIAGKLMHQGGERTYRGAGSPASRRKAVCERFSGQLRDEYLNVGIAYERAMPSKDTTMTCD
jgi:hypothetical protein